MIARSTVGEWSLPLATTGDLPPGGFAGGDELNAECRAGLGRDEHGDGGENLEHACLLQTVVPGPRDKVWMRMGSR
jgi:hypothetical protein